MQEWGDELPKNVTVAERSRMKNYPKEEELFFFFLPFKCNLT